jgi:hypothetical protein
MIRLSCHKERGSRAWPCLMSLMTYLVIKVYLAASLDQNRFLALFDQSVTPCEENKISEIEVSYGQCLDGDRGSFTIPRCIYRVLGKNCEVFSRIDEIYKSLSDMMVCVC